MLQTIRVWLQDETYQGRRGNRWGCASLNDVAGSHLLFPQVADADTNVTQFGVSMEPDAIVDFVDGLLDDIQDNLLKQVDQPAIIASAPLLERLLALYLRAVRLGLGDGV